MKALRVVLFLAAMATLNSCGMEVVEEGNRGIYSYNGAVDAEARPPGLHFYNPFLADIQEINVRERKLEGATPAFTKDTQKVLVSFAVIYAPDAKAISKIYSAYGHDWEKTLVENSVLASIKNAIGMYSADNLVEKREVVTRAAEEEIKESLKRVDVLADRLNITNLDFNDEYEKAVETKVTAIQHAIAEKNKTVQVQEQANQTIVSAKADAESMRIKSQALSQNKGLVQYEAVQKWDGKLPQIILGGQSMPILDLKSLGKEE